MKLRIALLATVAVACTDVLTVAEMRREDGGEPLQPVAPSPTATAPAFPDATPGDAGREAGDDANVGDPTDAADG